MHKTTSFINSAESLSRALGIADCAPELQMKIIGAWSDLLLKRILLRVPDEHTERVQKVIAEAQTTEKDVAEMLEALSGAIPGFELYIEEETTRLLAESAHAA